MTDSTKARIITCRSRIIGPKDLEESAQQAIEVNPLNRPSAALIYKRLGRAPTNEELTVATNKFWGDDGARLTVSFVDSTSTTLKKKILLHLNAWNLKANIEFVETTDTFNALVRINREPLNDPEWDGYWCFLGTDLIGNAGPKDQTMNLEGFTESTSDEKFRSIVRHEAGHALGFEHEHFRPELIARIDRNKAIKYYKELCNWTADDVDAQVLQPLRDDEWEGTAQGDPTSIMTYHVPGDVTIDGNPIIGGHDINQIDHDFAALIYPKP